MAEPETKFYRRNKGELLGSTHYLVFQPAFLVHNNLKPLESTATHIDQLVEPVRNEITKLQAREGKIDSHEYSRKMTELNDALKWLLAAKREGTIK